MNFWTQMALSAMCELQGMSGSLKKWLTPERFGYFTTLEDVTSQNWGPLFSWLATEVTPKRYELMTVNEVVQDFFKSKGGQSADRAAPKPFVPV